MGMEMEGNQSIFMNLLYFIYESYLILLRHYAIDMYTIYMKYPDNSAFKINVSM